MKTKNPRYLSDQIAAAADYAGHWMDFWFERASVPGLSMTIRHGNDILLDRGWGIADQDTQTPMTRHHVFRMASQSKMLTAIAIGLLQDDKVLDLNDPIARHLEWMNGTPLADIPLRRFMNHTAWISANGPHEDFWMNSDPFPSESDIRRISPRLTPVFRTTNGIQYSNWAYGLMGQVIAAASGQTYNDFISRRILRPLGLHNTTVDIEPASEAADRLAAGYYERVGNRFTPVDASVPTNAFASATGLCSTTADMTTFITAGPRLLRPETWRTLINKPVFSILDSYHQGCGFAVMTVNRRKLVGHAGGFIGHSSATILNQGSGLAISIATNSEEDHFPIELCGSVLRTAFAFIDHNLSFLGRFNSRRGAYDLLAAAGKVWTLSPRENRLWDDQGPWIENGSGHYEYVHACEQEPSHLILDCHHTPQKAVIDGRTYFKTSP